jgi:tetratricopeptide (TPR) repeat protein
VWSGRVLGTYHREGAVVRVNAYVYEDRAPLREVWEVLLRLAALSTLVHEVGHHYDCTMRVARGRWLASGDEHAEMYAEDRQHVWLHLAVIPWLREAYAAEVEQLERWIGHHGGVRLPLETLTGDPRGTRKGGAIRLNATLWSMCALVQYLIRGVAKGKPLQMCRVGFARDLHYREDYDEAMRSLALVLTEEPGHVEALTLRADIYVHQGRDSDALEIAREVLAKAPDHTDAWEVVADACEALERWEEMHAAASRMLTLYDSDDWHRFGALFQRATAAVRLRSLDEARADLATIERDYPHRRYLKRMQRLRAELDEAAAATDDVTTRTM